MVNGNVDIKRDRGTQEGTNEGITVTVTLLRGLGSHSQRHGRLLGTASSPVALGEVKEDLRHLKATGTG